MWPSPFGAERMQPNRKQPLKKAGKQEKGLSRNEALLAGWNRGGGRCGHRSPGPLHGILDRRIGTLESVFITYFSGGLLIGLIMLVQRGGNLGAGEAVPWYAYSRPECWG
jgi:hypothetical protein